MSNEHLEESMVISNLPFIHKTLQNECKSDSEILESDTNPVEDSEFKDTVIVNIDDDESTEDSKNTTKLNINLPTNHTTLVQHNHQKQVSEQFSELTFSAFIQPEAAKLKAGESRINSFTDVVSISSQSFIAPKEEDFVPIIEVLLLFKY